MNEQTFECSLQTLFESGQDDCEYCGYHFPANHDNGLEDLRVKYVRTFEDAGLLTRNKGLIITLENGDEFQLAIVKSK